MKPVGIPGEAVVIVKQATSSQFYFTLRSRANAVLLSGGPIPYIGDLQSAIDELVDRCATETAYRIDKTAEGNVLELVDEQGNVVGRSEKIATDPLTKAMLRLVPGQARRAHIVQDGK